SISGFLRRQLDDRRLLSYDELEFGNQVDDQLTVRPERIPEGAPPLVHLGFSLDKNLADQRLQGLCQRDVWYFAFVLVEFAGGESPRCRTITLCSSVTTEDVPTPE